MPLSNKHPLSNRRPHDNYSKILGISKKEQNHCILYNINWGQSKVRLTMTTQWSWVRILTSMLRFERAMDLKTANLVPRALFHGFGGGVPHLQSHGKAPWEVGYPTSKAMEKCPGDEVARRPRCINYDGLDIPLLWKHISLFELELVYIFKNK